MHLVVSISGHGYGHVAQTAPVLDALNARLPQLRLTIRSPVTPEYLRSRIKAPFEHLGSEGDIGMVMSSALDVRVADSRAAYRAFHANWDARVEEEAQLLRELQADLVLSNVGYLPLAGAQRAGIANVALCSLNWADIYRHYCGADEIAAQIYSCYAATDAFLRATPGMAMADLPNLVPIAPIATQGRNRRAELDHHLHLAKDEKSKNEKLILVSLGGIASRLPIERWPRVDGVRWLVQQNWQVTHPDAIPLESLPMNFGDLLASCDALLCKPGYGSFVEAASCAVPVLYVARPDWPESPALIEWLQGHGVCREVARDALEQGNFAAALTDLWNTPKKEQIKPTGAEQVAAWLAQKLCL
jgi:UDP:flavonoid glycosyltransferase YjiC (YdhE family)